MPRAVDGYRSIRFFVLLMAMEKINPKEAVLQMRKQYVSIPPDPLKYPSTCTMRLKSVLICDILSKNEAPPSQQTNSTCLVVLALLT